jgi:UDP-3-O-[3-hydroxymyristoyl] glucosamine N-acyltransferase
VADRRFFQRSGPFSLESIAQHVGAKLSNAAFADLPIHDIAALEVAGANDLSLFNDGNYQQVAQQSRAGAIITTLKLSTLVPGDLCFLYVADPRVAFAHIGHLFYPARALQPGIHPTALVHARAQIADGCQIDAGARLGADVTLGRRCHIEANASIDNGVNLGDDSWIGANSTIRNALIGSRVRIGSNSCIGGEGFGFVPTPQGLLRLAQLGRVIIGDGVQIGSNTSVDRGALGDTVIGTGTMIDNLVQVAHNVQIGRNCILAAQVGIAGSTKIGDNVMIGGQAAIADHITIGSRARIAGKSGVIHDVPEGETWGGTPAVPIRRWHRQTVELERLAARKVRAL